jgi:hypothetical protein
MGWDEMWEEMSGGLGVLVCDMWGSGRSGAY